MNPPTDTKVVVLKPDSPAQKLVTLIARDVYEIAHAYSGGASHIALSGVIHALVLLHEDTGSKVDIGEYFETVRRAINTAEARDRS